MKYWIPRSLRHITQDYSKPENDTLTHCKGASESRGLWIWTSLKALLQKRLRLLRHFVPRNDGKVAKDEV
jgi:hypothetical protein